MVRSIDFELGALGNRPALAWGQTLVKNEQIGPDLQTPHHDFIELATPQHVVRIIVTTLLDDTVDGHHTAGRGQFGEFLEGFLSGCLAARGDTDEDGAFAVIAHGIGLLRALEFVLEGLDKAEEIHLQLIDGQALLHVPLLAIRVVREERSDARIVGQAICAHIDGHHDIEAQMGQVGHIVRGKRLTTQVGVHIPETAQAIRRRARAPEVGEKNTFVIPHDDVLDNAFTIDQYANLAIDLERQLAEIPRQFLGDNLLRWDLATIDMLESMDLIRLQAC